MNIFEIIGHVDEQHRLSAEVPQTVPVGPVKIIVKLPGDETEDEPGSWARAVGQAWLAEWSDPREDIYTLEDGQPVRHGPK
jgi:hypothetical protein